MFTNLMLTGLKKQHFLIDELIGELEGKIGLDFNDGTFVEHQAVKIANNLRILRRIKDQYATHLESMINLD